ncbi:circadian clock KaiB family protein [uncultured Thiocystis sp.]|uniref:circadian clock KaiB family protein n=1 Tax=uncultured Thiocystis sp. TaxID=1202134 RepID=UPI0025D3E2C9|nr:circadian clock KaiB family protein [uncultured Thiocystis sp.]
MPTMKPPDSDATTDQAAAPPPSPPAFVLRLYVAGATPKSVRAIANLKRICKEHLQGNYSLEVIDLYQRPQLAKGEQIIAVPTLIKALPLPLHRMIGTLSDTERVLVGLDLQGKTK